MGKIEKNSHRPFVNPAILAQLKQDLKRRVQVADDKHLLSRATYISKNGIALFEVDDSLCACHNANAKLVKGGSGFFFFSKFSRAYKAHEGIKPARTFFLIL